MEDHHLYPNMENICRLCLKEKGGTVNIFPQDKLEKHSNMSIPMRIMSCAALEVQTHDGLPSKVCPECRYQLEKSYLFRKQSQSSDAKLRKHIRLLSLGKTSKVFIKNPPDEDDDDDEVEFHDSLDFIKEYEEKLQVEEQLKFEHFREKLMSENAIEWKRNTESLKAKCKRELRTEVEQLVKAELREEVQKQLEEIMLPKMKKECLKEAKESLREEVREECRQSEMKILLDDLQSFLKEKQRPRQDVTANKIILTQKIRPLSPPNVDQIPIAKKPCYSSSIENIEIVQMNDLKTATTNDNKHDGTTKTIIKPELILSDSPSVNDDDGDSDNNFLIYDTDEGFELQKKSNGANADIEDDNFIEEHGQAYDSSEEHLVTHDDSPKSTTTTSYRIEDSENGEIQFLKKSTDPLTRQQTNDDNVEQLRDTNIMIINFPPEMEEEEHLEMVPFGDEYESKPIKSVVLKGHPVKCYRTSELTNILSPSHNFTTTSTIETTLMAKTYVNTVQRPTDTPKIFKCNACPMVFSTNPSLERHLRTHRKGEQTGVNFQCPECQIVVSCASALRRHMYIHCNEKPFICKECGKAFVQKEILKRHMQTHTGIKPHQCPHCDRAFAQRINLRQHINRHHTEEPRIQQHSCHLCPKRFNHASGLSRHLASHSGVAFQCSECERTFGDRSSIKRHIANKHGNIKLPKSDNS